ncbi:precorrin-3B synthase [Roseobacter weihaiensis]|uniref:precorrin-3B synthase n=1 Tax=Roseobacter weihaiensis TaxID=2763262 RepID=UPI001D0B4FE7|nr:precorrin-3B synthase [Roseobacter sp. H9]
MTATPTVKGWCPGAHRPMMSGDGLIVRVRPHMSRFDRTQALTLCHLSQTYGNGIIDLTSRANLQLRGVRAAGHPDLLEALMAAGLLDATPAQEARRNILTTPQWGQDDLTAWLYKVLLASLATLPDLPAKMGIALDTGAQPLLAKASADFRFERGQEVGLILRADGADTGVAVTEDTAPEMLRALALWFVDTGGARAGRMARHLATQDLPTRFQGARPRAPGAMLQPGVHAIGAVYGVPFGAIDAAALAHLISEGAGTGLRLTPWRLFVLEGAAPQRVEAFVCDPGDATLRVHACPGLPKCSQGQAETRALALSLSGKMPTGQTLHVSGCAKGCAHPGSADLTLVGADGYFDLVRNGTAWDAPSVRGLSRDDIAKEIAR